MKAIRTIIKRFIQLAAIGFVLLGVLCFVGYSEHEQGIDAISTVLSMDEEQLVVAMINNPDDYSELSKMIDEFEPLTVLQAKAKIDALQKIVDCLKITIEVMDEYKKELEQKQSNSTA